MSALTLVIALATLLTGATLMVTGVVQMRRSARRARIDPLGTATGTAPMIVGAVLIGTVIALVVLVFYALGSMTDN